MISHRLLFTLPILIVCVLLIVGCVENSGGDGNVTTVSTTMMPPYPSNPAPVLDINSSNVTKISPNLKLCPLREHVEYRVIQGQPFTFHGTAPANSNLVDVFVYSGIDPNFFFPLSVPVDANGSFSVIISGSQTRQDWVNYIRTPTANSPYVHSPYDHVCLKYSTATDCFDLLLVDDEKNLTTIIKNNWIRIDPIPDQFVSGSERSNYTGNFFINGTTNLPMGEEIRLSMYSMCYSTCMKSSADNHAIGCCGDGSYKSSATVQEGSCGFNTWSVFVNTTPTVIWIATFNGVSGDHNPLVVDVRGQNRTATDNEWDAALFYGRLK